VNGCQYGYITKLKKKKPYSTHYFVGCNLLGVKKCNNKEQVVNRAGCQIYLVTENAFSLVYALYLRSYLTIPAEATLRWNLDPTI
jgi:hypothetical protein